VFLLRPRFVTERGFKCQGKTSNLGEPIMSYDGREFTVRIGHLERRLPLFQVAPGVKIAIFNMLGDTEVVETAADLLVSRLPIEAQVIVVPEVKAVPLGHALAVRSQLPFAIVRKIRKPYMANTLEAEVVSITTGVPQTLYLDGKDLNIVQDKNVVLLDDVISTGNTLRGMRALMKKANATVVGEMAVFTEGKPEDWLDIIALGNLPVFTD
jgi:adenine phosphoribosyltransferase